MEKGGVIKLNVPIRLQLSDYKLLLRERTNDYTVAVAKGCTLRP